MDAQEATATPAYNVVTNAVRALLSAPAGTLVEIRPRVPRHVRPLLKDFLGAWRALNAVSESAGQLHGPPGPADLDEAVANLAVVWSASHGAIVYVCRSRAELTSDPALGEACYQVARAQGRRVVLAVPLTPQGRLVEDFARPMGQWAEPQTTHSGRP